MTVTDPIDATASESPAPDADPPIPPDPEPAPEPSADLPAQRVPGLSLDIPIIPGREEMRTIAQMAVTLAYAKAVPTALYERPNDVFLILVSARDLGVSLTTALREFHVIEGKVTLSPKVKLAMARTSGLGRIFEHQPPRPILDPTTGETKFRLCPCGSDAGANDAEVATWHAERHGDDLFHTSTFTMTEARAVTTRGKVLAEKDNWTNYPKRMLSWRALGYLLDDVFPEVGTGLYSPDELGALTDEEGNYIEVSAVETPPGMKGPKPAGTPPEVEPPDEAVVAELRARMNAAREVPAAMDELKAWWGERHLPVLTEISARQAPVVLARLNALETKYEIPAYDPEASQPEAADPAPGSPPGASEPPAATTGAPSPETATQEPGEVASGFEAEPDETPAKGGLPTEAKLAEIAALLETGEIIGWLIERGKILNEASIVGYARLHAKKVPEGNLNGLRRWWCETEAERIFSGVYATLRAVPFLPAPVEK